MYDQRPNVNRKRFQRRSFRRRSRNDHDPRFVVAVDFGFERDFTALVLVERVPYPVNQMNENVEAPVQYHVLVAKRFPLGTRTGEIVNWIRWLTACRSLAGQTGLIVDKTGVGSAVVHSMSDCGLRPVPITITGGRRINGNNVPKTELLSRLSLLLEQYRLRISARLAMRPQLKEEFDNFFAKYTVNGKPTYSASSAAHDDLIMALCLAVHFFEGRPRLPRVHATVFSSPAGRSSVGVDLARRLHDRMMSRWLEL